MDSTTRDSGRTSPLDIGAFGAAAALMDLGFQVIPIPYKTKSPNLRDWPSLRIGRDELARHFPRAMRSNVGLLLGSASVKVLPDGQRASLVDIDIDRDALLKRAAEVLPPTGAIFGRHSRPQSHRLYWVTGAPEDRVGTTKWQDSEGVLIELRGCRSQTIGPGSVHPDDEEVCWHDDRSDHEPGVVTLGDLTAAVNELAGRRSAPAKVDFRVLGWIGWWCQQLRVATQGTRNDLLYKASFKLGLLCAAGQADELRGREALRRAALESGLKLAEVNSTIESGVKAGRTAAVTRGERFGGGGEGQRVGGEGGRGGGGGEGGYPPSLAASLSASLALPIPPGLSGGSSGGALSPMHADLVDMASVNPEPMTWLWPGVLPLGKLCCLAGDPGLGKSFVTLDIAARVTRGMTFPSGVNEDGEPGELSSEPGEGLDGHVLLLSAEDDPADTIRPRLDAAGADHRRITLVPSAEGRTITLDFVDALHDAIDRRPDTKLIVIDPVSAYFPQGRDSHKQTDVRALLAPLAQLAQQRRVCMLLVAHLNKDDTKPEVYRVSGSLALPAACRAVWMVSRDPDDPSRRVMKATKLNVGKDTTQLAYRLEVRDAEKDEKAIVKPGIARQPRVVWEVGRRVG